MPNPAAAGRLMAVLDADGDARLSEAEFERVAHPDLPFVDVDLDHDGSLDVPELNTLLLTHSPLLPDHARALDLADPTFPTLSSLDRDGDGVLTAPEWAGAGFEATDLDHDDKVDGGEFRTWLLAQRPVKGDP